jgi:hypothetical protein
VTPLEQWLSDATRGLSAESAAQVRAEIQQHYDSACEAGDDAIAALGNPRTANRAYRKVLLTKQEAMLAPAFTQPEQRRVSRILLSSALLAAFFWLLLSRKQHGPGFWPVMIAILSTTPFAWFFPPTTLERCRIYTYVRGARSILVVTIAWWYYGWVFALPLGAVVFLLDYFLHYQRLSIFRKLAAGQTYSLLPEEPRLTHLEAIVLRRLQRGEPHEKLATTGNFLMIVGMTVWQPATFLPMATCLIGDFLAQRTLPIYTEERSRWYRIAKWAAMAVAAVLPVLYGSRIPWSGAAFMAFIFALSDLKSISIRRKLPAAQWPKRLYW